MQSPDLATHTVLQKYGEPNTVKSLEKLSNIENHYRKPASLYLGSHRMEHVLCAPKLTSTAAVGPQLCPWVPIHTFMVSRSTNQGPTVAVARFFLDLTLYNGLPCMHFSALRIWLAAAAATACPQLRSCTCPPALVVRSDEIGKCKILRHFWAPSFGSWAPFMTLSLGTNYPLSCWDRGNPHYPHGSRWPQMNGYLHYQSNACFCHRTRKRQTHLRGVSALL